MFSSYGSVSQSPYALSLDATTIDFTFGLRRAASSSAHVPLAMFDSNVDTGLRFAMPTMVCAAR